MFFDVAGVVPSLVLVVNVQMNIWMNIRITFPVQDKEQSYDYEELEPSFGIEGTEIQTQVPEDALEPVGNKDSPDS